MRPKDYIVEHRIASAAERPILTAVQNAITAARESVKVTPLMDAVMTGNAETVTAAIPWASIQEQFTIALETVFIETADKAAQSHSPLVPQQLVTPKSAPITGVVTKAGDPYFKVDDPLVNLGFAFDLKNPETITWARIEAALTVQQITENTRLAIRAVIVRMFEQGIPPAKAAREIRRLIGLDERMARAVVNYRSSLERTNDRRRLRPQPGQKVIDQARIDAMVDKYAARALNQRALTIARTESMKAASFGQHRLWEQAIRDGFLEADRLGRVWIVTPDERLCPVCAPMPSNPRNHAIPMTAQFETGDGTLIDRPPAHPRCRCALRLVFRDEEGNFPAVPKARPIPKPKPKRRQKPLPKR